VSFNEDVLPGGRGPSQTPDALSRIDLNGPAWLAGGATRPEASRLVFPVLAGVVLVVRFDLPWWA
jgi:hypothetical protein